MAAGLKGGCWAGLKPSKFQLLLLGAALMLLCLGVQLRVLHVGPAGGFSRFLKAAQRDASRELLFLVPRWARKPETTWERGTFCHDFLVNTYQEELVKCEGRKEMSDTDQIKCYGSVHSSNTVQCSYEDLFMRPREMLHVIPADSTWEEPKNRTIGLLRRANSIAMMCNHSVSQLVKKASKKDYQVKLTHHLLEAERLPSSVCDIWINKTTFFHISNAFHIYFRFMDLYNVHKSLLDHNMMEGEYLVLRIGNLHKHYIFPEFDRALFPGAQNLHHLTSQVNGTVCFRKVVLVPRSYQSVPFQCKMSRPLKEHCFECSGKGLTDSPLHSFRRRVLKACNVTLPNNSTRTSRLVVVSRKPYKRWPGDEAQGLKRVLQNEVEMVDRLHKALPNVSVEVLHMEELEVCEQVRVAAEADVMLGVHGAGLVHFWWLRDGATAFELEPTFQTTNPTFRMLTTLTGRNYVSQLIGGVSTGVSVNIDQLILSIQQYYH